MRPAVNAPVIKRRHLLGQALALPLGIGWAPARAQAGGAGVLFGFPGGSPGGLVGEAVLPLLNARYQPSLGSKMRYLPGNVSRLAIEALKRGTPDGSQVLLAPSSVLTLLPLTLAGGHEGVLRELRPATPLTEFSFVFTVSRAVPDTVRSLADYAVWLREQPDRATVGLPGLGTCPHLLTLALASKLDLALKPVAYQGTSPQVKDLLSGAQPAGFVLTGAGSEGFADGRLRALAVASDQRWPGLPQVPTLIEQGLVEFAGVESYGYYFQGDVPLSRIDEFNAAVHEAKRDPAWAGLVNQLGMRVSAPLSREEFSAQLLAESLTWLKVVAAQRFSGR